MLKSPSETLGLSTPILCLIPPASGFACHCWWRWLGWSFASCAWLFCLYRRGESVFCSPLVPFHGSPQMPFSSGWWPLTPGSTVKRRGRRTPCNQDPLVCPVYGFFFKENVWEVQRSDHDGSCFDCSNVKLHSNVKSTVYVHRLSFKWKNTFYKSQLPKESNRLDSFSGSESNWIVC